MAPGEYGRFVSQFPLRGHPGKYNPIEHRLFPHVTRACQGVIFVSVELIKELIERTKTKTGLTVTVDIISGNYRPERKRRRDSKRT